MTTYTVHVNSYVNQSDSTWKVEVSDMKEAHKLAKKLKGVFVAASIHSDNPRDPITLYRNHPNPYGFKDECEAAYAFDQKRIDSGITEEDIQSIINQYSIEAMQECVNDAIQTSVVMDWENKAGDTAKPSNSLIRNRLCTLALSYFVRKHYKVFSKIECEYRAIHYGVNIGETVCIGSKCTDIQKARLLRQFRKIIR